MEIGGRKIHDVRLMFRKAKDGSKVVRVTIRDSKKGKPWVDKTLPFTEDLYDNDPNYWESHQEYQISVYHRKDRDGKYVYINTKQHSTIPTEVGQKLEGLISKVFKSQN